MKKVIYSFLLISVSLLTGCSKEAITPSGPATTMTPKAAARGITYSTSESVEYITITDVPLTLEFVTVFQEAISNNEVEAFLGSDIAEPVVSLIPEAVLAKFIDSKYRLVLEYETDGPDVVSAQAKVILVASGNVESAVNLRL